jgi:Icc-related predicted phosphoesterase
MQINANVLALPGNLDEPDVGDYLVELGLSLHGTGRLLDAIGIFGVGGSNITPFNTPIEFGEEELAVLLNSGYDQVKQASNLVLVSHAPPFNTKTDLIGSGAHVGSTAVREFIEKIQPVLCITGHIHESRAEDTIGRTRILNPGMIKDGGWIEISIEQGDVTAALKS